MLVAAFLILMFVVVPALSLRYGKDSRVLDRPGGWFPASPRT